MEKSWIFWNFEIFWNFWKSHGILTKNGQGHGKVIEFLNLSKKSHEKIMESRIMNHELTPLRGSFSKSNWRVCQLRGHGICDTVMEKSWRSHGILSRQFLGNPVVETAPLVMILGLQAWCPEQVSHLGVKCTIYLQKSRSCVTFSWKIAIYCEISVQLCRWACVNIKLLHF